MSLDIKMAKSDMDMNAKDTNQQTPQNTLALTHASPERVLYRKRNVFAFGAAVFLSLFSLLQGERLTSFCQENLSLLKTTNCFYSSNMTQSLSNSSHQPLRYSYCPRDPKVYALARSDEAGSAILHMMLTHAWAFSKNYTYLGVCEHDGIPNPEKKRRQLELLQFLGLTDTLPFRCPPQTTDARLKKEFYRLPIERFRVPGRAVERRTPEWIQYIQSQVTYPPSRDERQRKRAVIHIRRGDVIPCLIQDAHQRYLPNWYFKELVERHVPTNYDIIIHSEEISYEPWSDFTNDTSRNYQLRLSSSLTECWEDFITADIFIDSRSHFSAVPAMLNRYGRIIHTPKLTYPPLPNWTVAKSKAVARAVKWNLKQRSTGSKCFDRDWLDSVLRSRMHSIAKRDIMYLLSRANHSRDKD